MQLIQKFKKASLFSIALAMTMILFSSCNKESDMGDPSTGAAKVAMTDGPGDYANVTVEVDRVEIYSESKGWISLSSESNTYVVSELTNGKSVEIGSSNELAVGAYTKIRLSFGSQSSITAELGGLSLQFASIAQQQVEIPIDVTIESNATAEILLDFQIGQSIKESLSGYILDPVIHWVQFNDTGVEGDVEAQTQAYLSFTRGESGDNAAIQYETYTDINGDFIVRGMLPGMYTVEIEARDTLNSTELTLVGEVQVSKGEIVSMGTLNLE